MKISIVMEALTGTLETDMKRASRETQRAAKQMQKSMEETGKAIGLAISGVVIGISALVKSSINAADDLAKMSQKVGIGTESLSALKFQAKLAGVEVEGMQTALVKFSKTVAEAAGGSKQQAQIFDKMGISLKDLNGNLKPNAELLREFAEKMSGYKDGAAKTALAQAALGKSGAEMIPMLNGGAKAMDDAAKEAAELRQIIGPDMAKQAEQFNDNLSRASMLATGFGNIIAAKLLPSLVGMTDRMIEVSKESGGMEQSAEGVVTVLKTLARAAILVKGAIEVLVTFMSAAYDVLIKFGQAAKAVAEGMGQSVAGAILKLKGDFAGADAAFAKAKESFAEGWEGGAAKIQGALGAAGDSIKDIIANNGALIDALDAPLKAAADGIEDVTNAADLADAPIIDFGTAAKGTAEDLEKLAEEIAKLNQEVLDGFGSFSDFADSFVQITDPIEQANARLSDALKSIGKEAADQAQKIQAAAAKSKDYNLAAKQMVALQNETARAVKNANVAFEQQVRTIQSDEFDDMLSGYEGETPFERLTADLKLFQEELAKTGQYSEEEMGRMEVAVGRINQQLEDRNTALLQDGISSVQKFAKEGTAAFTALGIAQDVLAYKSAVAAIATQGSGDPYTAFARIAAMIALMASIGIRVGGGGGSSAPSSQSAEVRQASQGTGTILGDSQAKSESILKAVEITANASDQLVGINRGMLSALQSLQQSLGNAGGLLARGAGNASFNQTAGDAGNWNWLFGGDSAVIDTGIVIAGGALQDMLNEIAVGAYQTIETSGGWFHSDSVDEEVSDVTDTLGRQFQLVIGSIIDAVQEGAEALGLLPADIQAALDAFAVEEIRISLEGLSAEDQQAELEAVFSSIFDGLAGAVAPFIGQFQQVGEGLGETLVRVATEVQVMQQAILRLGLSVNETDPEKFAQIADGLIQMAGGVDEFIQQMNTFTNAFASEGHQFQVAIDELNSAFSQAGLSIPATREAMWELMQSLDATTEQGREQIATLLRLAGVADSYYSTSEDAIKKLAEMIKRLKEEATSLAVQLDYRNEEDTLDYLNSQIAALGNGAADSADAIGQAVDSMREKMSLLLGDLSPFNDQKKLELALQGLREGTVDPQQVLEIGRRLYASTSNYTNLFNQVMGMANFGGGDVGATGTGAGDDGRTLQELIAARDALLAAQRPELAQDLAERIAELSYATGDTFQEIADQLGFGLEQLGADLGLSGEQLDEYLQTLSDQFENNDFSAVGVLIQQAIDNSADRIVSAITGEPIADVIDAADDRMEAVSKDQTAAIEASNERVIARLDALMTTVVSSGVANTEQIVGELSMTRRDFREVVNGSTASGDRGTRGLGNREYVR